MLFKPLQTFPKTIQQPLSIPDKPRKHVPNTSPTISPTYPPNLSNTSLTIHNIEVMEHVFKLARSVGVVAKGEANIRGCQGEALGRLDKAMHLSAIGAPFSLQNRTQAPFVQTHNDLSLTCLNHKASDYVSSPRGPPD